MAYTTIDKPSDYFETKLYTGTSGTINITGLDFQPDWVWCKNRASGNRHALFDAVRGVTKRIRSDGTDAEAADPDTLTNFNSDGFTVGADAEQYGVNKNGDAFVSWNWKAGTSFSNDASSTSIGSIDSAGSVNTTAGFSIVTFTGNSGGIAHGLGQKPDMVIIKPRNVDGSWIVTHKGLGAEMQDYYQFLDTTAAKATSNDIWGGEPTTTTFSVSSSLIDSANYVAYCFAEKKGYSKFGSYTGNGNADGTFTYTGFKPAFVIYKRTDGAADWHQYDNKRETFNVVDLTIFPSSNSAESSGDALDFLSNGFKQRNTGAEANGSGSTYIYMAFAKNPFVTSTGVPATAR